MSTTEQRERIANRDRPEFPDYLLPYWGNLVEDPREKPAYCYRAARKGNGAMPWHNTHWIKMDTATDDGEPAIVCIGSECIYCGETRPRGRNWDGSRIERETPLTPEEREYYDAEYA